jgi:hypothetical protein
MVQSLFKLPKAKEKRTIALRFYVRKKITFEKVPAPPLQHKNPKSVILTYTRKNAVAIQEQRKRQAGTGKRDGKVIRKELCMKQLKLLSGG